MIWLTQGCQAWSWVIWESTAFQSRKRQGDGTVSGKRHVQSFLWSFEQLIPRSFEQLFSVQENRPEIITKANLPSPLSLSFQVSIQSLRHCTNPGPVTCSIPATTTQNTPRPTRSCCSRRSHRWESKAPAHNSQVSMLAHPKPLLEVISQAFPFDWKQYYLTIATSELLYYKCFSVVFRTAFPSAMVLWVCAWVLTAAGWLVFLQPYGL